MEVGGGTFPQSASRDDKEGDYMCLRVGMNVPAFTCEKEGRP